jgi:hypothetical protein
VQGQVCLTKGTLLGPPEIGILATIGATDVSVYRKPLVAVLSSGDEVVEPDCAKLGPGQIRDCNRSMLVAAVREAGARVLDLGIAKDQVCAPHMRATRLSSSHMHLSETYDPLALPAMPASARQHVAGQGLNQQLHCSTSPGR